MKKYNFLKGRKAEEIAKTYLESKCFVFLEANYKNNIGEIDLVMSDHDWLVFIEVKYKSDDKNGLPEEMINKIKVNQVRRVADLYILTNNQVSNKFVKYRIDAVCILGETINYYQNILG